MIGFLFKGIIRDKNRSLLPLLVISLGVFFTVLLSCFLRGVMGDVVDLNAKFSTGHVKVTTRAYAENATSAPNDLALLDAKELVGSLKKKYPSMEWAERIHFGGLMDVGDEKGNTRAQGPTVGLAIDLLSPNSKEAVRLNIQNSLVSGRLPRSEGEALISAGLAKKLGIKPGDEFTLFGSTMYGAMTFKNFKVAGSVAFGNAAMDRGSVIIDIKDARNALDMEDAAGEILGYFSDGIYDDKTAAAIADDFNSQYAESKDEFAPRMLSLKRQNDLASMLDYMDMMTTLLVFVFVLAMSIVLWNAGLLGGLRRYSEFGLRLALGEEKRHIYASLIYESIIVGAAGSVIGAAFGLGVSFLLQKYGLDFGFAFNNSTMMMPTVYRALVTPSAYYVGFIPGLISMVLGAGLAGIGIYKRKTAQLFKELEA